MTRRWLALAIALAACNDSSALLDGGPGHDGPDGTVAFQDKGVREAAPPSCDGGALCASTCCTKDQICLAKVCTNLGPECDELWPCGKGFYCDSALGRCVPGATPCEYRPPVGVFGPKVKWEWTGSTIASTYNQVMMAPMVANLTDDNKDGKIDRNDVPDVVFNTFAGSNYQEDGILRVISGDNGKEHFAIAAAAYRTRPGTQVAIGDIDNDQIPEIVACADGGGAIAFEHDGKFKWRTAATVSCSAPAIADLDGDGKAEVVVCYSVLEGATGAVRWTGKPGGSYTTVADIDEDGKPEVVGGNAVFSYDGKLKWEDTTRLDGYVAVADLDGDGKPEIITASSLDHALNAYHHDGKKYWGPVDINQGKADLNDKCKGCGGGPPTVADFDGDGKPEIAAAAGYGYVIFEHDGAPKWFKVTQDISSRTTGSSVFDFEGDGKAEVVYGDELLLRIYNGVDGAVLFSRCNTSGTLQEYPVIVDVDNDDHAEIVVANNNYAFKACSDGTASKTGIRVLSDAKNNWVRTRRIWNQHTYHVTNVDEDGKIPKVEARNWDNPSLNNFRQNVQPGGLFDAPDLAGDLGALACGSNIDATVIVKNVGAAKVLPGIKVTLYVKESTGAVALQTTATLTTIYAGGNETVSFSVKTAKVYQGTTIELFARVDDDGTGAGTANECKENNNEVQLGTVFCKTLQ
jgi:hypothetical protein